MGINFPWSPPPTFYGWEVQLERENAYFRAINAGQRNCPERKRYDAALAAAGAVRYPRQYRAFEAVPGSVCSDVGATLTGWGRAVMGLAAPIAQAQGRAGGPAPAQRELGADRVLERAREQATHLGLPATTVLPSAGATTAPPPPAATVTLMREGVPGRPGDRGRIVPSDAVAACILPDAASIAAPNVDAHAVVGAWSDSLSIALASVPRTLVAAGGGTETLQESRQLTLAAGINVGRMIDAALGSLAFPNNALEVGAAIEQAYDFSWFTRYCEVKRGIGHRAAQSPAASFVAAVTWTGDDIYVSNCGRNRVLLIGTAGVTPLSVEHRANEPTEAAARARSGDASRHLKHMLEMSGASRAVVKEYDEASCRPQVARVAAEDAADHALVMLTEGVYDVLGEHELAHIVAASPAADGATLAAAVGAAARARGHREPGGVVAVRLDADGRVPHAERPPPSGPKKKALESSATGAPGRPRAPLRRPVPSPSGVLGRLNALGPAGLASAAVLVAVAIGLGACGSAGLAALVGSSAAALIVVFVVVAALAGAHSPRARPLALPLQVP